MLPIRDPTDIQNSESVQALPVRRRANALHGLSPDQWWTSRPRESARKSSTTDCDVTTKLSTVAHRCIVQLVVHMNQSSHSPGVPLCHNEVTKGLQVDNMDIGCTLVSKQSAIQ
ncbi:hypothetical protein HKD37_13G035586 [Glycine soja]